MIHQTQRQMKVYAIIGHTQDSKKIIIKDIRKVVDGAIYTGSIGNDTDGYYTSFEDEYTKNHFGVRGIIPQRESVYLMEQPTPDDCTYLEANDMLNSCVHLGGDKFLKFERVSLWDNTITGLNCLGHKDIGEYGGTVFKVGATAKLVRYFKTISRQQFLADFNRIDF